jgi:hypothetical protein
MPPDVLILAPPLVLLIVLGVTAGAVSAIWTSRRRLPPSNDSARISLLEQRLEELEAESARSQEQIASLQREREFLERLLTERSEKRAD